MWLLAAFFRILRWLYSLSHVLVPYICGPLTELAPEEQERVKSLFVRLADVTAEVQGKAKRAFVPHEHYDPIKHRNFTPRQVYAAEFGQVVWGTSRLVIVAVAPSWGGGMEAMMAYFTGIPVDILCEKGKLENRLISRLLRGGPRVTILTFDDGDYDHAVEVYRHHLSGLGT